MTIPTVLLPYHKVLDFTTVLSTQPAGRDERVARRHYKFAFYHNFERPTRTKSREGCHSTTPYDKVLDFTTVLSTQTAGSGRKGRSATLKVCILPQFLNVQHARNHERVAMVSRRIRVLPQFWASDTSEVTKGLLGHIQNLHFTTVLSVPTRPK